MVAAPQLPRIAVALEEGLGWVRIENPACRNAVSRAMWTELQQGVETLSADPMVRVIIIAGGSGHFCAGADISEFGESGAEAMDSYERTGKAALSSIRNVTKPTIAMIEGCCIGGGLALALQCDLRIAAESARFSLPAVKRGLAYDFDGTKQMVDLIGPSNAKYVLFTGRQFTVHEARARGLVNDVRPSPDITDHVRQLALAIGQNAPLSVAASKLTVDMAVANPDRRDQAACSAAAAACLHSEDYREATRAFVEKRPARFKGR